MLAPVLIVDTDPSLRELIAYGLGRAGWAVELAANGTEALARICGSRPGAVVLDLELSDIHGIGVLEVIRRLWPEQPVPVVMLGRRAAPQIQADMLRMGADAYLSKPLLLESLVATVERIAGPGTIPAAPSGARTRRKPRMPRGAHKRRMAVRAV